MSGSNLFIWLCSSSNTSGDFCLKQARGVPFSVQNERKTGDLGREKAKTRPRCACIDEKRQKNHRHRKTRQFFCDDVALLKKALKLYRKHIQYIDKFPVDRFVDPDGLVERDIDYLVVLDADHDVALAVLEGFDGGDS